MNDILILWNGYIGTLCELLATLNNMYHTIKFTIKIGGQEIGFLDLKVSIVEGRHTFDIHRKSTNIDFPFDDSSFWSITDKNTALLNLIHRL